MGEGYANERSPNRGELEAAYTALLWGGDEDKSHSDLWDDDDLWLFCRAELHPGNPVGIEPPMSIGDIKDVLVRLADLGNTSRRPQ